MKLSTILLAGSTLVGLAAFTAPAMAGPCPVLTTDPNGLNGACNLTITFSAGGGIATTGIGGNYDGSDDALIGVINNSGHTITSFNVSNPGVDIFGFDGDGIDVYVPTGPAGTNPDTTGYGGPNGFFTNINGALDSGTVNFANGGIANGSSDYFSLEEAININVPPIITTPEPLGIAVLGMALAGLGLVRRRKTA